MVIFLQFSVSGNAISIVATHMSLLTYLFALISFKSKKTRMARKFVIFQNFEKLSFFKILKNCQFSNLHIFTVYQMITNFITVVYLTLLSL